MIYAPVLVLVLLLCEFRLSLQDLLDSNQEDAAGNVHNSVTSITKDSLGKVFDSKRTQCGIKTEDGTGIRPFKLIMSVSTMYVGVLLN